MILWWRRALITITAAGAVVASFVFLTSLAVHAGWPTQAAWLLPLCVDALAAMSLTQYRATGDKGAGATAVLAIALSALGNAASHWYATGLLQPDWVLVTAVGAVPAVSLGVCIHLITKGTPWDSSNDGSAATGTGHGTTPADGHGSSPSASGLATNQNHLPPVPKPPSTTPAAAAALSPGSTPKRSSKRRTDPELLHQIRTQGWEGETLNGLVEKLGVSKSRASRLRRQLTENSTPASVGGQPSNADMPVDEAA